MHKTRPPDILVGFQPEPMGADGAQCRRAGRTLFSYGRGRSLCLVLGIVGLLGTDVLRAVTLLNPSFEDSATWQTSGWLQMINQISGQADPELIDNAHPSYGETPFGQRYVLMSHPGIGNAVMRYVTGFEVGQNYELSFWAAASTSQGVVQIGGLIGVQNPLGAVDFYLLNNLPVPASRGLEFSDWSRFSITFTAPTDTLTLWIGQSGQGFGPVYFPPVAIDQVSITAVPEPLFGLFALAAILLINNRPRRIERAVTVYGVADKHQTDVTAILGAGRLRRFPDAPIRDSASQLFTRDSTLTAAEWRIAFPTVRGRSYTAERSATLVPESWVSVQTIPGDGAEKIFTDLTVSAARRFYRLRVSR